MTPNPNKTLGSCLSSLNFKTFGNAINVSSPGKVILHGEHSVVYNKLAIAASLGLRTKLRIVEVDAPDVFVLELLSLNYVGVFKLSEIKNLFLVQPLLNRDQYKENDVNWETPDLFCYKSLLENCEKALDLLCPEELHDSKIRPPLKLFFYLFSAIFSTVNIEINSICVSLNTDLTIGAGTGSSASCNVAVAAGMIQYLKTKTINSDISKSGFKVSKWDLDETNNINVFSKRQLYVICKWAFQGEKIIHGTPSGVDNTVCTYGNIVEFRKNTIPRHITLNKPLSILLINTKVSRKTSELVARVAQLREKYPTLVNNILNAMEEVAAISLRYIADAESHLPELERLFTVNHSLLCSLGVSHPKLDEIVLILSRKGLHGKLTGAGGGGYAICLLPHGVDDTEVNTELKNAGFDVLNVELGGEGVRVD